jgi:hypothetical protein
MFERRDVWELSEENSWHSIIDWYARAVTAMQSRDGTALPPEDFVPSDPTSWRYLAEIHGTGIEQSGWSGGLLGTSASTSAGFSPVAPDLPALLRKRRTPNDCRPRRARRLGPSLLELQQPR